MKIKKLCVSVFVILLLFVTAPRIQAKKIAQLRLRFRQSIRQLSPLKPPFQQHMQIRISLFHITLRWF